MCRKQYLIRLSCLVANERHLEEDLKIASDCAQRRFVELNLHRTRKAIDELHHTYTLNNQRVYPVRGRV